MAKRGKLDSEVDLGDEEKGSTSVICLSSSDDEEANEDLTLKIVEKAREREIKRKRNEDLDEFERENLRAVVDIKTSSSSSDEVDIIEVAMPEAKKKKTKKKKKKTKTTEEEGKDIDVVMADGSPKIADRVSVGAFEILSVKAEESLVTVAVDKEALTMDDTVLESKPLETVEDANAVANRTASNAVLRKLLRGPRYFDPPDSHWETCLNCGKEGHRVVNCTEERRKKPCFVCGEFGHSAKNCSQGQDCFNCKRTGHFARDCPEKHHGGSSLDSTICLQCGDLGHDMSLCRNDYAADDLKEIQCYVCKNSGHLCCADINTGPREVSCYNCGQSGHTGFGCAKLRGETSGASSPALCYKCGEEGHFARGCTRSAKPGRWVGEPSTPIHRFPKEDTDFFEYRSVPHDFVKSHRSKTTPYKGRKAMTTGKSKQRGGWFTDDVEDLTSGKSRRRGGWVTDDSRDLTSGKSRQRGGWIADDPGDLVSRKHQVNGWKYPATPTKGCHKFSTSRGSGHNSNFQSPLKKHNNIPRSPSSHASTKSSQHHGFSASRFSNSRGRFGRAYD